MREVVTASLGDQLSLFHRSADSLLNRHVHSMKLVIAGHLLDGLTAPVVFKDNEVTHEIKKEALFEDTAQKHFHSNGLPFCQRLARDSLPGHEAFLIGSQRAEAGMRAI